MKQDLNAALTRAQQAGIIADSYQAQVSLWFKTPPHLPVPPATLATVWLVGRVNIVRHDASFDQYPHSWIKVQRLAGDKCARC